jgi:hypothetical protein
MLIASPSRSQDIQYIINEFERMWKVAVMASFGVLFRHLPEETEEDQPIPSLGAEICIRGGG